MKILTCNCKARKLKSLKGKHHHRPCPMRSRRHVTPSYDISRPPHKIAIKAHSLFFSLACNRGGVKVAKITLLSQYTDGFCYGYTSKFSWTLTREYTKGKMQLLQAKVICDAQEYLTEFAEQELKLFHWRVQDQTEFGGDVLWIPPNATRRE